MFRRTAAGGAKICEKVLFVVFLTQDCSRLVPEEFNFAHLTFGLGTEQSLLRRFTFALLRRFAFAAGEADPP